MVPSAIAGDAFVGRQLAYGVTAPWTGRTPFVVDLEEVADLDMHPRAHPLLEDGNRCLDHITRALVDAPKLVFAQGFSPAKRIDLCREEDLV